MIVHEDFPFNSEPTRAALGEADITPVEVFYSRNHGPVPDIDVDDWKLTVSGQVARPLELCFDELASQYEIHTVLATLQCAGNRRAGFNDVQKIAGEDPWGPGATSTARWSGCRLGEVLRAAAVRAGDDPDLHVAFSAPDVSQLASPAQAYGSSIPLDKALSDEVLLAWTMNDQPLPRLHGGPVRVVVPGYIGARSVKWVTGISVQAHPSDNYFQATAYRILPVGFDPDTAGPDDGISLSSIALNCDILAPDDGSEVSAGQVTIRGYALAGDDRDVARVDVSLDRGRSWRQADLAPVTGRWTWRWWSVVADVKPGPLHVIARAWDSTGALQPESAAALWNPKGYANNSWAHLDATAV